MPTSVPAGTSTKSSSVRLPSNRINDGIGFMKGRGDVPAGFLAAFRFGRAFAFFVVDLRFLVVEPRGLPAVARPACRTSGRGRGRDDDGSLGRGRDLKPSVDRGRDATVEGALLIRTRTSLVNEAIVIERGWQGQGQVGNAREEEAKIGLGLIM